MLLLISSLFIVIAIISWIVKIRFDALEKGDYILYYEEDLPTYDVIYEVKDLYIITNHNKRFNYWDFLKGNFFKIKKD